MKFEALNAIALFEGAKGLLALLVAVGINVVAGQDLYQLAERLMQTWSLSTDNHYLGLLLRLIDTITHQSVTLITLIAILYASFRFIMAYGLWRKLRWTEWFAFISGSLYIPFELHAIYQNISIVSVSILLFNLLVIGYLYWVLKRDSGHTLDG